MINPCDICLDDKDCNKTNHKCNCSTCKHKHECRKFLHPTIRITTKCTQTCEHCCFSCSPSSSRMMSIETAKEIALFLQNNDIKSLNVMGGEFFCNPDWYEILNMFLSTGAHMRLVSNSDWADNDTVKDNLCLLKITYGDMLHISISKDIYHTNVNVASAGKFLSKNQFSYDIGIYDTNYKEDNIVPIGRGQLFFGIYSLFSCYCQNPQHMYSFLIDEDGTIFKCSFGCLDYATVQEYMKGGFAKRFKEYNQKFYATFISSCKSCVRMCTQGDRIVKN